MEAARWVEKVRINPGNFADSKKFTVREYTDEQYAAELERIGEKFTPLVRLCQERGLAMRIGTNHGSLSDRIMNRYGDTPLGMVESALEFARIAREHDFHNFIFSMKASNPEGDDRMPTACWSRGCTSWARDWNYPDPPRRHRGGRRRGRPHQERHRHRLAAGRRHRRHHPRLADGGQRARDPRGAGARRAVQRRPHRGGRRRRISRFRSIPLSIAAARWRTFRRPGRSRSAARKSRAWSSSRDTFEKVSHKLAQLGDFQPEIVREEAVASGALHEIDPRDAAAVADRERLAHAACWSR